MSTGERSAPIVGILAIHGSVEEHAESIKRCGGVVREIRKVEHFEGLDAIILPGGESTTMAIVGERWGLFPKLREWVAAKKPIWGTCAGMILLSDHAIKQKEGGQSLVGGLDVHVCRNFFGAQVHSCQIDIDSTIFHRDGEASSTDDEKTKSAATTSFPAVFIRAPAILKVGSDVEILAKINAKPDISARKDVARCLEDVVVEPTKRQKTSPEDEGNAGSSESASYEVYLAVKQDNILATSFHPELTNDDRWHRYFLDLVEKSRK